MKKIAAFIVFVLSVYAGFSQSDSTAKPMITSAPPAHVHKRYEMKVPKDRIVLDLNGVNWIRHDNAQGMRTRVYSRGLNLYGMYDMQIMKSRVSFAFGFGVSFVDVYTNSTMHDSTGGTGVRFTPMPNYPDTIKLNKVALTYLDIPLELRIRSNRDRFDQVWKVNIGFKFGVRVDTYTRTVYKNPRESIRLAPDPDFNLFRLGPTLRVGYSSFNLTAYYGLLGVIKSGRGPDLNEWSFGISFNGL